MSHKAIVSLVHGYNNLDINLPEKERPALWQVDLETDESEHYSYPFPRNPSDFICMNEIISGSMPFRSARDFKKLPRFGFMGIETCGDYIFAGNWNAVYKIRKDNLKLEKIISNNMINDVHGIYVDANSIITVLTSRDAVVISDHDGNIVDYFSIMIDLSIVKEEKLEEIDWRFISKQFRGSKGYWHFNYIQKFGDELWLTSRNTSAFIVVNLVTHKAHFRLMNLSTPSLLHDGKKVGEKYYFTSIDGKIIIAEASDNNTSNLYNRDLVTELIRLSETSLGREPNWCRGIDVVDGIIYTTIDGRYDTDLSFGLLALREDNHEIISNHRLRWSEIGNEDDIRFVTGFDIIIGGSE